MCPAGTVASDRRGMRLSAMGREAGHTFGKVPEPCEGAWQMAWCRKEKLSLCPYCLFREAHLGWQTVTAYQDCVASRGRCVAGVGAANISEICSYQRVVESNSCSRKRMSRVSSRSQVSAQAADQGSSARIPFRSTDSRRSQTSALFEAQERGSCFRAG